MVFGGFLGDEIEDLAWAGDVVVGDVARNLDAVFLIDCEAEGAN